MSNTKTKTDNEIALEAAFDQINKKHGKKGDKAIMLLGEDPPTITRIPTGSLALDIAIGGGFPEGRIIEIYGPESSGKTLLTLSMIASVQSRGGVAAFVDVEHAFDPEWAVKNNVDINMLAFSQPSNAESALEITEILVNSHAVDLIVLDSVAALTPQSELDGDMDGQSVGVHAKLMARALRKLTAAISDSKCTVVFINQLREKIGVMFGSPETTPGGKALKFYASVRLDVRKMSTLKEGVEAVGIRSKVTVVKNKTASPFKKAEYDILTTGENVGIQLEGEILDKAVDYGFISKSGAFYTLNGDKYQGKSKASTYLRENTELRDTLYQQIMDKVFPKADAPATVEEDASLAELTSD